MFALRKGYRLAAHRHESHRPDSHYSVLQQDRKIKKPQKTTLLFSARYYNCGRRIPLNVLLPVPHSYRDTFNTNV